LSTLNFWFFMRHVELFEQNDISFQFPSEDQILSQCSHFAEPEAAIQFCDLLTTLYRGPEDGRKAVHFAERLVKEHDFFLPLRNKTEVQTRDEEFSPAMSDFSPHDEAVSLAMAMGGVDQSPNSLFQRLVAQLALFNSPSSTASSGQVLSLLHKVFEEVRASDAAELAEKIRYGALDVFVKALRAHAGDLAVSRKILQIAFQIVDTCPCQRHILMQLTSTERETGLSFFQYLVQLVSNDSSSTAGEHDDMLAASLHCIGKIVSCSIPYHSLSDFPSCGCYADPKMESMLTANVLRSILLAVDPSRSWAHCQVLTFFLRDSELADRFFVVNLDALRRLVREDNTVREYSRLCDSAVAGL
jgi:hypothetical protein